MNRTQTNPIKILHVLHSFDIGGLENGLVNLINNMDPERFSHKICCIGRSGRNAKELDNNNVVVFEMNKRDGLELGLPLRLARLFKQRQIDVVHTRNWGAIDGIIGAKLVRVPYVIHGEHGRDMSDPDGTHTRRNVIRKLLSRFLDSYITVSEDFREWLVTVVGIDEQKVETIRNGVDTTKFNPYNKDFVRAKHNCKKEEIII